VVISTDSHNALHLLFIRHGVATARRGWLETLDVINTLPAEQFLAALRPKPGAAKPGTPGGNSEKKSAAKM
jgi:DNA polymerase (family X)